MQVVYLIFMLVMSCLSVYFYRLGLADGNKDNIELPSKMPRSVKRKKSDGQDNIEAEKIKTGIKNILDYGIEVKADANNRS